METPVVEPIYVFSHGDLKVVDVPPWAIVADKFSLEHRVERLGECVVVALSPLDPTEATASASSRRWV